MRCLQLTEKEWELLVQTQKEIDTMMEYLATLSREQRFQWYREHQYCYPISFEKEVGSTVYSVTAHFNENAGKTLEEKTEHVITRN